MKKKKINIKTFIKTENLTQSEFNYFNKENEKKSNEKHKSVFKLTYKDMKKMFGWEMKKKNGVNNNIIESYKSKKNK